MAYPDSSFSNQFGLDYAPESFLMRIGRREIFASHDFRKRFYKTKPIIERSAGLERGHPEVLLFRRWRIILSKAR
jgi:hypothetical protein